MTIQHDPSNVNNPEHLEHHVVGPVTYAIVFGTLLLCTLLTVLAAQIEMGVFDTFQIPYSALQREHEEVIAKAADTGHGTIIRGGVARGTPTDWNRTSFMVPNTTMKSRWEEALADVPSEDLEAATRVLERIGVMFENGPPPKAFEAANSAPKRPSERALE